jgi:CheY-like chemotaxis protein
MKTILVVDDESEILSTVRAILEDEGYRIEACSNGREALARLSEGERPDLVLTDVMMPYLSGIELVQKMKGAAALRDVPVILMSSVNPPAKKENAGWDRFLKKPFSIDDLLFAVSKVLAAG